MNRDSDIVLATLGEGGLILTIAAIGWATGQPLIFASLGPTAYELIEQPHMRSARAYNIIAGHFIGLGAGFLALWVLHGWSAPNVMATGVVAAPRIWAATLAGALTTFFTLLFKAGQPAALSTTLLVSLGGMQTRKSAIAIVLGVILITGIGEPLRRIRKRMQSRTQGEKVG
jgi:hypothetical protein